MLRAATLKLERSFSALVILGAVAGVAAPQGFLWLKPYIPMMLGVVIFGIGLTIRSDRLKESFRRWEVWFCALAKFAVMPAVAYGIALLLRLPTELMVGMVILSACPGGTSANIMSYLARANTTLAVVLTVITTMLSPVVTPLVVYLVLQAEVSMDLAAMMQKLFWVVLFPLVDALIIRRFFARAAMRIEWVFPPLSMLALALIVAFVTAGNHALLLAHPWLAVAAVLLFNMVGYAVGYGLAHLLRMTPESCRAMAFEYGVYDSALGVIVASGFFAPLAALPSALSSIIQNVTGPWLARRFLRGR